MNYSDWEDSVHEEIKGDALWQVKVYRLSLFVADLGWVDTSKLMKDRRTWELADQLTRALGSISANFAEGYSRSTGKARTLYFEYALGSARESRDWMFKARHILGENVAHHRVKLLTEIIRLLLTIIREQRPKSIRENPAVYALPPLPSSEIHSNIQESLPSLLSNIPLPDP